jgi:hypothetical protein
MNLLIPSAHASTVAPTAFTPSCPAGQNCVDISTPVSAGNFFGYQCITQLVFNITDLLLLISGLLVFFYLVLGGTEWIMSGGDKGKIENARSRIINAFIGLAIVAIAWAIYKIIVPIFFGIDISNLCTDTPVGP